MSSDHAGSQLPATVKQAIHAARTADYSAAGLDQLAGALEHVGDTARADYFRAVVARDRTDLLPGEWRRYVAREMTLFTTHFDEWFGRLEARADGSGFTARRGFPEVMCYDSDLVLDGDTNLGNLSDSRGWPWGGQLRILQRSQLSTAAILNRLLPLPLLEEVFDLELVLHSLAAPEATALCSAKQLAHLRGLHLHQSNLSAPAVKAIVDSPLAGNLRALSVWADAAGLAAVAAAAGLAQVQRLRIRGDQLSPTDWEVLGNSPHLSAVRELDLCGTPLDETGMAAFASTPLMSRVESLYLSGVADPDGAVRALAVSPYTANLRALTSQGQQERRLTSAGLAALAASPYLGNLRALDLSLSVVKADGIKALAKSRSLHGLERLGLWLNPLGAAAGKTLATAPIFGQLTDLRLEECKLGEAGGLAVAQSTQLTGLRVLNLAGNGLSGEVAATLARPGAFDRLRVLVLGCNKIDDAGVAALAAAEHWTDLGILDLSGQGRPSIASSRHGKILSAAALQSLIESRALAELALLCVDGNVISWKRHNVLTDRFGDRVNFNNTSHWLALYR